MAKTGESGAQKMLAEIQALKEEVTSLKTGNSGRFDQIDKMCRDIMAGLSELSDTNTKILQQKAAGGSKSTGARGKAAVPTYVDADGNMKSSSDWFKCIWVTNPEETRKNYITKKHIDALNEFMKDNKRAQLPADKKLKEQVMFIWNTFVNKTSEKADNVLRNKIVEGYSKAKAEVEAAKASRAKNPAPAAAADDAGDDIGDDAAGDDAAGDDAVGADE